MSYFLLTHFVNGVYTTKHHFGNGMRLERTFESNLSHNIESFMNLPHLQLPRVS